MYRQPAASHVHEPANGHGAVLDRTEPLAFRLEPLAEAHCGVGSRCLFRHKSAQSHIGRLPNTKG